MLLALVAAKHPPRTCWLQEADGCRTVPPPAPVERVRRDGVALYGFLRPKPEHADEVRRILSSFVEPTRQEPGNLQYHLHEQEDGRFFLYEVWRSQEDLDRHNPTPPLRAFLEEAPEGYFDTMLSPYPDTAPVPA
ncbi:putative quinol monooxygenase [Streptomyces sp. NPDC126514]|uniref:putative quinol monooxygenase n=1 Tax=Streptomyces sp. NPDC126514 TaxID=3155210 RepID=UPI003333C643